jgi:hypothetical protein
VTPYPSFLTGIPNIGGLRNCFVPRWIQTSTPFVVASKPLGFYAAQRFVQMPLWVKFASRGPWAGTAADPLMASVPADCHQR